MIGAVVIGERPESANETGCGKRWRNLFRVSYPLNRGVAVIVNGLPAPSGYEWLDALEFPCRESAEEAGQIAARTWNAELAGRGAGFISVEWREAVLVAGGEA
ncbi:MAG TPA: hypothetical protein VEA80_06620 [Vitreimonas sp.]|uniref:hypothetical protein n=1 Tax=Vitreimonas sp. TaxID=3069702 RepID=UPI002D62BB44|nr:hypothetical protein [Vitreimonas sp.]HYD87127.1 hypothetical protein [Vitreimonas sp.]